MSRSQISVTRTFPKNAHLVGIPSDLGFVNDQARLVIEIYSPQWEQPTNFAWFMRTQPSDNLSLSGITNQ